MSKVSSSPQGNTSPPLNPDSPSVASSPAGKTGKRFQTPGSRELKAEVAKSSKSSKRISGGKSAKITPLNATRIEEEGPEDFDFERFQEDQKDSGVDFSREEHFLLPALSVPFKNGSKDKDDKRRKQDNHNRSDTHYILELDEDLISEGFPSDLPSGLIDIEGNLVGEFDFRFNLEEDENSLDSIDHRKQGGRRKSLKSIKSKCVTECNTSSSSRNSKMSHNHNHNHKCSTSCKMNGLESSPIKTYANSNSNSTNVSEGENFQHVSNSSNSGKGVREFVHRRPSRGAHAPLDRHQSSGATSGSSSTITQHYYPEGGWGFVVLVTATSCHSLLCGIQLSFGILMMPIFNKFGDHLASPSGSVKHNFVVIWVIN